MGNGIPTGKTYIGFILLWSVMPCAVAPLCVALCLGGFGGAAMVILLLAAYLFFKHSRSIGKRAGLAFRRPTPELRRWLAITSAGREPSDRN
jgi:hypothetical protein